MDHIIDYLMDETDDMQVIINDRIVFSNQALIHMKDVKVLYTGGIIAGWFTFISCLLIGVYFYFRFEHVKKLLFKYTMYSLIGIIVLLLGIGIFALVDFDAAFKLFHKLAFPTEQKFNDAFFSNVSNYQEVYYVNNLTLVNILSIEVFMDVVVLIFLGLAITLSLWITFTVIINKKSKKMENISLI